MNAPCLCACLSAGLLLAPAAEASEGAVHRFALLAGSNAGGEGRPELRYAVTDARAVARVLEQMGGVAAEDRVLLETPDRRSLLDGFARLARKIDAASGASGRTEVLVYYSGHSDESGLLLGSERFGYAEMRAAIQALNAKVRIAILDSCASGAMVRFKGGTRVAPFLVDDSTAVSGHAFLTATSAQEAAQESDRIQSSYFTYALVTGLRGAADSSRDGKVTLSEAYQYAFNETLARTEASRAGPQHPTYDIQLVGSGDLVMTDLRGTSAGVVLAEDLEGRLYLRDSSGQLVAELRKLKGSPIELGLEPGRYEVTLDERGVLSKGEVVLVQGERTPLVKGRLQPVTGEVVAVRGEASAAKPAEPGPAPATVLVDLAFFWPISVNGMAMGTARNFVSIPLGLAVASELEGISFGPGVGWVRGRAVGLEMTGAGSIAGELIGAQGSGGFNVVAHEARGLQVAGGANFAGSSPWLGQLAGGLNLVTGPLTGLQSAGGANFAGATRGAQLAGGVNVVAGPLAGLQSSGGANFAGATVGAQVTGGVNVASGAMRGLQLAGGVNVAGGSDWLVQFAGGVNYAQGPAAVQAAPVNFASASAKAQLGAVNVALGDAGLQVGVVNVAKKSGLMLGVLNFSEDGYLTPAAWASDFCAANVGLKSGGHYLYTVLGLGMRSGVDAESRYCSSAGLGVHLPFRGLFADIDVMGTGFIHSAVASVPTLVASLRAQLGWQIFRHLAVVGGPTLSAAVTWDGQDFDLGNRPQWVAHSPGGRTTVRVFPGLVAGVQF